MKLKETIIYNIDIENGIFKELTSTYHTSLSFLQEYNYLNLDIDYYFGHSGEKDISILFFNLLQQFNNNFTQVISYLSHIVYNRFGKQWERTWKAITQDYKPLNNYDMSETEEVVDNETRSGSSHSEQNSLIESTNSKQGFNSNTFVNDTKNMLQGSLDNNFQNDESNSTKDATIDRTLNRSGNIGVTTTQKMLQEEIEIRKYDFIKMVMRDIDKVLCSKVRLYL